MLPRDSASIRHAARIASIQLGLGEPELLRLSSAATFVAGGGFLRVVGAGDDPIGTLEIARMVSHALGGALPLTTEPIEVDCGEVSLFVEPYERLPSVPVCTVSFKEQGERLAALHSVHVEHQACRPLRRADACLERLAAAPDARREALLPLVTQLGQALNMSSSTMGLCHGDPSRGNLLATPGGPVWVDFEYAGIGPISHDVAFCIVELTRFSGADAAREFAAGYQSGGGQVDAVEIVQLSRVRDIYGVVDYSYQTDAEHYTEFAKRLASFNEPFRQTMWSTP